MERSAARKFAGVVFGLALIALLISVWVALVYHGDQEIGASWITAISFGNWIAGFSVVIAVCFVILLILFIMPAQESVEEPRVSENAMQVTCANCQQAYVINDPGTRPLYHQCPHCSFTNQLPATEDVAAEAEAQESMPEPRVIERIEDGERKKFLVLNCGNCHTNFETPYSEERPIITSCSNCGRRGILK